MIELQNIRKSFRTGNVATVALNGLSLTVEDGEFLAVMGPSGCGKTTLLNVLGLLDIADEGRYILDGKDVTAVSEHERTLLRRGKIGYVFQSFNLLDELTVAENVELPLIYLNVPAEERKVRVHDILKTLAISHRAGFYPIQLSGGQQQRVAIARAVIAKPQIILADEPTGNLDSKNGKEVMAILRDLHRSGTTIVMVTHNQRDAFQAERVVNLYDGQIITL